MKEKRIKGSAIIRLDVYKIIDDTIYTAIQYGYSRAHKHTETPSKDHLIEEIHKAIMNDLSEILNFDDE